MLREFQSGVHAFASQQRAFSEDVNINIVVKFGAIALKFCSLIVLEAMKQRTKLYKSTSNNVQFRAFFWTVVARVPVKKTRAVHRTDPHGRGQGITV
jgi:hypothetical protein